MRVIYEIDRTCALRRVCRVLSHLLPKALLAPAHRSDVHNAVSLPHAKIFIESVFAGYHCAAHH